MIRVRSPCSEMDAEDMDGSQGAQDGDRDQEVERTDGQRGTITPVLPGLEEADERQAQEVLDGVSAPGPEGSGGAKGERRGPSTDPRGKGPGRSGKGPGAGRRASEPQPTVPTAHPARPQRGQDPRAGPASGGGRRGEAGEQAGEEPQQLAGVRGVRPCPTPFITESQDYAPAGQAGTGPCIECPWCKHTFPSGGMGQC